MTALWATVRGETARAELRRAVDALGVHPRALVRMADAKRAGVDLDALGDDESGWIELLATHPTLIERPVLITGDGRAVIGRPPEAVEQLLT